MIIGITGRLKCGKDTLATYIQSALPDAELAATVRTAFAKKLRDVAEAAFGSRYETQEEKAQIDAFWDSRLYQPKDRRSEGPESKLGDEPVNGRRVLQFLGTEMFRVPVHPNFWIMCLARQWDTDMAAGKRHLLVTDVRFDNEAEWVRSQDGVVIRLRRPDVSDAPVTHASEAGVSDDLVSYDLTCGSLEDLRGLAHLVVTAMADETMAPFYLARASFGTENRVAGVPGCVEVRAPKHHTIGGNVSLTGSAQQGGAKDDTVCADFDSNPEGPQG